MEVINDGENLTSGGKRGVEDITGINLVNGLNEGAKLRELLKWYFHMVENLGNTDLLVENLNNYKKTLGELEYFADSPFMKSTYPFKESGTYGERLRQLLVNYCNNIGLVEDFSKGNMSEYELKEMLYAGEMKKMLEFCDFLENKSLG